VSRRAEESASPQTGASTADGTTNSADPAPGLDAATDLEEPAVGYFVAGLASDEPDPVGHLALPCSQPRAAISVEPSTGLGARARGARLGPSGRRVGAEPAKTEATGVRSSANGGAVTDRRRVVGRRLPGRSTTPASGALYARTGRHSVTSDLAQHERINAVPRASTRPQLRIWLRVLEAGPDRTP